MSVMVEVEGGEARRGKWCGDEAARVEGDNV
jgi:hypothetical protein